MIRGRFYLRWKVMTDVWHYTDENPTLVVRWPRSRAERAQLSPQFDGLLLKSAMTATPVKTRGDRSAELTHGH